MITPRKHDRVTSEWRFRLPMCARELSDAVMQVETRHERNYFNDRYFVKSDGEDLIFYWEED